MYLLWLENRLSNGVKVEVQHDDMEVDGNKTTDVNNSPATTLTPTSPYLLAKRAPYPNTSVDCLVSEFCAVNFIPALQSFLSNLHCPTCPS